MSLTTSIYTSVNGMNAMASGFSVIGDNLANMNTTGFKESRALFSDILGSKMQESGVGSEIQAVDTQFQQGTLATTGNPLDFAIEGNGFFIVKDTAKGDTDFYTRAGSFKADKNYYFVNGEGLRLQGYQVDNAGNVSTTLGDLHFPLDPAGDVTTPPTATTTATVQANLGAADEKPEHAWSLDPVNGPALGSSNFITKFNVYDNYIAYDTTDPQNVKTLTNPPHEVNVYYAKTGDNTWQAHVVWNAGKTTNNYQEQVIDLNFDTNGNLTNQTGPTNVTMTWDPAWNAAAQTVAINFADPEHKTTQYGSPDSTAFLGIDGSASGGLTNFITNSNGEIFGIFSNGQKERLAQLALAHFNAPTELKNVGGNLFAQTNESGDALISTPASKGAGTINPASLEMSSVDLAGEFVNMLTMQRAFQANTSVMQTTNQMYTTLVNLQT